MSKTIKVNGSTYHLSCNWQTRELVPLSEVPTDIQETWFDYVPRDEGYAYDCRFFNYRGSWYDSQEFEHAPHDVLAMGFNGVQTESAFSAVVIQYFDKDGELHDDGNSLVVGYIHW